MLFFWPHLAGSPRRMDEALQRQTQLEVMAETLVEPEF
jgi:hypothetical protein